MKNKTFLYLILFIACNLYPYHAKSQQSFIDRYTATYITMNEGLPHNFVDDIYKDSQGFLWIAMEGGGLSRYDGYEFINFNLNSSPSKLKSNFVYNVTEDNFHRLWVASEGGLDIINLSTMQAVNTWETSPELSAIGHVPIIHVAKDTKGHIWLYANNRIYRIELLADGQIDSVHSLSAPIHVKEGVMFKDLDQDGNIWMQLDNHLCKIKTDKAGALQTIPVCDNLTFDAGVFCMDILLKDSDIWLATNDGLLRYNRLNNLVKHYRHIQGDRTSISQNYLTALALTNDQQLIVASLKGLNVYNPITDNFERIEEPNFNNEDNLLNSNFINCLTTDGRHIWIGTESGGINKLALKRISMQNYRNNPNDPTSLSPNPVNAIYEDCDNTLWVGTVEGGLNRKAPDSNQFTHYTYESGTLTHNSVSSITADPQGRLWVGTWGGGITWLDRKNPKQRIGILPTSNNQNSPLNFVGALTYDSINNAVWIGSNQGIFLYDLNKRELLSPLPHANIHGCIGSIIDREGKLWMGCMEGVYIIDLHTYNRQQPDSLFAYRHLKYKLDHPESDVIEKITCFYETREGVLWLGSNGYGIYKREKGPDGQERFKAYTTQQGLSSNSIKSILEDDKGYLWITTNNGLSRFNKDEERFSNYTIQDGIANTQFYWNAACRSHNGELYFGNMTGMIAINSELPTLPFNSSPVRFTQLYIENEKIPAGSEMLPQDLSLTKEIRIHERHQAFTLEFSSLNFESEEYTAYSYRLNGFDKKWTTVPANRNFVTYTNLSPGTYTMQVKYIVCDQNEQTQTAELTIVILPYFYRTGWFFSLVTITLAFIIWQIYQWRIHSFKKQKAILHQKVEQRTCELNQQKQLLEKQKEELSNQNQMLTLQNQKITQQKAQLTEMTSKIRELTMDRIAFFTNITHEFRTPITLIIGPIERALKLSYNPQVIEQLHFVERNSKYLLSLVNQLMDFRKVESEKMEISKNWHNFQTFINELLTPFVVFAQERGIHIQERLHLDSPELYYDEEAMHKVLTNLMSNAIKFTPNGGTIRLYAASLKSKDAGAPLLYLCVSDTGNGIPKDEIQNIFNRFYQAKQQVSYPVYGQSGSGIGLYLCQRIVQMQNGSISARNNHRVGCSFRVLLPLDIKAEMSENISSQASPVPPTVLTTAPVTDRNKKNEMHILIVEDNPDMRSFIRSILEDKYKVTEAADGVEALHILNTQKIDFIICDLMMPNMDGIELSHRVKRNIATAHIPFLMLTAKTSQKSRIESYQEGVDGYLLKPFDEDLLLARIDNILENRKRSQLHLATTCDSDALSIKTKNGDKQFIERVTGVMKANYKNPMFDVNDFCEAMGGSRTQLNQRLQSLVGQPIGQFIRMYRLNLARQIILAQEGKGINVTEIAYEVGFNDPKYFSRCFQKVFNIKPRELLSQASHNPAPSDKPFYNKD